MLTTSQLFKKKYKRLIANFFSGDQPPIPLFVFGEQRSGTNMMMRIFNRCPSVECYDENDDEAFDNYVLREVSVIDKLIKKSKFKTVAFKPICDSQNAHNLLNTFTNAKAFWIFRHYYDVVNSSLRNFHDHRSYLHDMLYDKNKAGWRVENVTEENMDMVRYFHKKNIDDASSRALIWYLRNSLYFQQNLETNKRVLLVRYEELVNFPLKNCNLVFNYIETKLKKKYTDQVFKTSINKNKAPLIEKEIEILCKKLLSRLDNSLENQKPMISNMDH